MNIISSSKDYFRGEVLVEYDGPYDEQALSNYVQRMHGIRRPDVLEKRDPVDYNGLQNSGFVVVRER